MAASFDTPLLSKFLQKPFVPPSLVGWVPAKTAFAPEGFVTMWSDWVELWDVGTTLRVMLHTMAQFTMLVL